MWILVGGRTRVHRIDGGRQVRRRCDECEQITLWAECNVRDKFELFFIPLLETKSRRMVCMSCGEDVDPSEVPSSRTPEPPSSRQLESPRSARLPAAAPTASSRASELPVSSRASAPPLSQPLARVRPDDPEIDDMLAALKAKLGK